MRKKIAGNWHKIDIWRKENCIVGYKSGGIIFVSLIDKDEIRYIPFYNFSDFMLVNDLLIIADKNNNTYQLENINSEIQKSHKSFPHIPNKVNIESIEVIEDVRSVDISDNLIICAYKQKGLDFFHKNSGERIFHFNFPGYSFIDDIKYFKNHIFIADVFGLRILDITDVKNSILDDSNIFRGWPKDVAVYENYVFVADVLGVKIFDKTNNFKLTGKFETNKNRVAKVIVKNNFAFLSCEARGLRVLDISNIKSPELISGLLLPKGAWDIAEYENNLYIASYTDGLIKVEYNNIKNMKTVARFNDNNEIIGIYVNEKGVFASSSYNGILILNQKLEVINQIKINDGRCWTTITYGNFLFSACGKIGVLVYDIADMSDPLLIITIQTKEARDLVIRNELLYVADGQNGVDIFDIKNPSNPRHIRNIPSAAFTRGVMVDNDFIYKADGDGGLEIYEKIF
jgi:hypothetical protein